VPFRACCGKLRPALVDALESLPPGARVAALRWGRAEISVTVDVGSTPAASAADSILVAAQARLGADAACYSGQGALLVRDRAPVTSH
jgi:hypothetical protein